MGTVTTLIRYAPSFVGFALRKLTFNQEKKKLDVKELRLRAYHIIRNHTDSILGAAKANVITEGKENIPKQGPVLFVGNHQSLFDVVAHLNQMDQPTIFVAKKELESWPVFGKWMTDMGCLFLDREDPRAAVQVINEAARRMREEGVNGVIYPEGTRSRSSQVHEFQKGSFKLAEKAKAPVVPVMIDGAYRVFEGEGKLQENQTIYMKFLPPIYLDQLTKEEEKVIHKTVRHMIEEEIRLLHEAKGIS
ncbi:lysophospholipid acyltransferase family protein [Proteiniclasticum sp. QWL-01]|uniref:lysophospholipid acyltransferase family protein n=1 Tax=Proteiniclasticum sp. QWL-01 TaxID=3036945 RepID=UPI0024109411|nr:lysophospholipid acyltransferase family protein [Proteiniclasticum sp. QWL-01]WFF71578.1 lysophospholipid acyltransferase family protein [Proteiniclasticum sp. QWL-01]